MKNKITLSEIIFSLLITLSIFLIISLIGLNIALAIETANKVYNLETFALLQLILLIMVPFFIAITYYEIFDIS